jgi:L-malate glycosyltransferase
MPRLAIVMSIASPWARLIARHLARRQIDVRVIDLQPWGAGTGYLDARDPALAEELVRLRHEVSTVQVIGTPRPLAARLPYAALQLRNTVKRIGADVVFTLSGGSEAAATYLSGLRPYVVYVAGSDILLAGAPQRRVSRHTLAGAAAVVANGKHLAHQTTIVSPEASVTPWYHGIETSFFTIENTRVAPRFLCARPFLPVYDNDTILRAFAQLEALPADFEASFLSFGPLLEDSKALTDSLFDPRVRSQVRFDGWVSDSMMRSALQSATFYVSASLSDGTSTSLLEAMACGTYPIVSDIPANREWIEHGRNGLLFRVGDHHSLASSLKKALATDPGLLRKAQEANRQMIEDRANIEVNIETLIKLFRSLW